MSRVRFHSLALDGFGLYEKGSFAFQPGINTYVSPNETGKSTMLAGLLALLFGLPEKADAESWGTARFRSWHRPQPFRGELVLISDGLWHRIRRDFDSHLVDWRTAPCDNITPPQSPTAWQPRFCAEHNPAARNDSVRRYQGLLRDLIGIDDVDLFRLTFCLAQDIDERTDAEEAFRTREVPGDVQQLLSGSGGSVDDARTALFDQFAAISMATAEAGLIRPGRKRARNQTTQGRLEEINARLAAAHAELGVAAAALEQLQGSQENLEKIRIKREQLVGELDSNRRILAAWDGWTSARAERRDRQKRIVDIETAIRQLASEAAARRQAEEEFRTTYPEYHEPGFPFAAQNQTLQELLALEDERARIRREIDAALHQKESHEQQQQETAADIDLRFAPFARNPHLLRDFQSWKRVAAEMDEARRETSNLNGEISRSEGALQRIGRWAALDTEAATRGTPARPLGRLRELSVSVPRVLERAEEARLLASKLAHIRERMEGPLSAVAQAPEELRQEARLYKDRQSLLQAEVAETARKAQAAAVHQTELRERSAALAAERQALAKEIGIPPSGPPLVFPPAWANLQQAITEKLSLLREDGELRRDVSAIPRMAGPTSLRRILVPAILTFLPATLAGFVGTLPLIREMSWRIVAGLSFGVVATAVAVIIAVRRSAPVLAGLPAAFDRLQEVRTALEETDRKLGSMRALDGRALETIQRRLQDHASALSHLAGLSAAIGTGAQSGAVTAGRTAMASDRGTRDATGRDTTGRDAAGRAVSDAAGRAVSDAPTLDPAALDAAARKAAARLAEFEQRMSALGDDPQQLVVEWTELSQQSREATARLTDLAAEIGSPEWDQQPIESLPPIWRDMRALATIVAADDAASVAGNELDTGGAVATVLRKATPADWHAWEQEALRFEQAQARLAQLRARRDALEKRGDQGRSRLAQLEAQAAELAAACAPLTLQTAEEDIVWSASEYEKKRDSRERSRTLQEKTSTDIAGLEAQYDEKEVLIRRLRNDLAPLLKPTAGDPVRATERLRAAGALREKLRQGTDTERQVLRSHGVEDAEALRLKKEALSEENAAAVKALRERESRFPLLREIADASPEEIQRRYEELNARAADTEQKISACDEERDSLQHSAAEAHAEGRRAGNVAVLETEIRALTRERETLQCERDALKIAFDTISEAQMLFGQTYRDRLAERASAIFRDLTGRRDRALSLGERFEITARESDGRSCALRQLSQGARDQLALAMRLAVAELLSAERTVPLLLDDPFLAFDPERLAAMRETLARLGADRQILLLSHRAELAAWGKPISVQAEHLAKNPARTPSRT